MAMSTWRSVAISLFAAWALSGCGADSRLGMRPPSGGGGGQDAGGGAQAEVCDNGEDDDGDGVRDCNDDDCQNDVRCGGGGGGGPDAGGAGDGGGPPPMEICDNGLDENRDGQVDENCACEVGAKQACYPGLPSEPGKGKCARGMQECTPNGEFATWGPCMGALGPQREVCDETDNDCNGKVDDVPDCLIVTLPVNINGDCVTARCPPNAPFPIGCNVVFNGGDSRGCVASSPNNPVVFFKEGDVCSAGHVMGSLKCSSKPGMGLNAQNCPINKPDKFYPMDKSGCPD